MFKERTVQNADAGWVITDGRLWSPQRRPAGQRRSVLPPGGSAGRGYRALPRTVVREGPSLRRALLEARRRTLARQAPVGPGRVASRPAVRGADRALALAGDSKRRSVYRALSALSAGVAHGHRPHLPGTLARRAPRYGVADRPGGGVGVHLGQGPYRRFCPGRGARIPRVRLPGLYPEHGVGRAQ